MMRSDIRYRTVPEEHEHSMQHDLRLALRVRMMHSGGHPKWARCCGKAFREGDWYVRIPMKKTGRHYTYYCKDCADALRRSLA